MSDQNQTQATEVEAMSENEIFALRREKLAALRGQGEAYPNDFKRKNLAANLHQRFADVSKEDLEKVEDRFAVAGRIVANRVMGKASFASILDMSDKIQIYIRGGDLAEGVYDQFKTWDLGDIVGVEGKIFKTNKGELSIWASDIRLLTKSLSPLPDKFHGLADQEVKYRQRYLDLISNEKSRETFRIRTKVVDTIRHYLVGQDFLEVETPMMQPLAGGAAARPFETHHNALDIPLFLRIAPELYLKRLVVGGFEKVFEINRNFRNEGLSTRHNPEFTMLEFYEAYADYLDAMQNTENMIREVVKAVSSSGKVTYQGEEYDFNQPFQRMTVVEAILHFNPELKESDINTLDAAKQVAHKLEVPLQDSYGLGKVQIEIFEKTAEHRLIQPTFITAYPTEVSPLARKNEQDPFVTDRFEFFVGGREVANGFSELNDPEDQEARFRAQVEAKADGDDEAMPYDEDYIHALEYGMPPAAGVGIGIDRLTMMLTDSASIRDVILFPQMRPKE